MKKIGFFILFLLSMCAFSDFDSSAHSGRTDASGGHNCSEASKAKGLCTGYHYHNGGAATDTSTDTSTSTNVKATESAPIRSNDKNCSDFANYDEAVAYWNAKGYSATYDPENLDGFGNKVDDGIPCEPPSDYDLTKVNNSKQQISAKETADGGNAGKEAGFNDGYKNVEEKSTITGSKAYQKGFKKAYAKAYKTGEKKFKKEKKSAYDTGFKLGKANKKLEIPSTLSAVHVQTFKSAFKEGKKVYTSDQIDKYYDLGYDDGKNDNYNLPTVKEDAFLESYKKGFKEGQKVLKEEYVKKGFESAFKNVTYAKPNLDSDKLISWYKEGFESNTEVKEIEDYAFNQGKEGEDLVIPDKYKQGEVIYNHLYEKGKEEYVSPAPYIVGGGVVVAGGIGYFLYRRKKKNVK